MNYTIQRLAELSGVSTRTLRHYDAIGLLRPERDDANGYRIYRSKDVDILQQILFYKTCGFELEEIKIILKKPNFNIEKALQQQKKIIQKKQKNLKIVLQTIKKTLETYKGSANMTDDQKFHGLKQNMLKENDEKYGEEVKQRWSEETWQKSNKKFAHLTKEQFDKMEKLDLEFKEVLAKAFETHDPSSALAQQAVILHKEWLLITWPSYSKEAHVGLTEMYVADERFAHFFNKQTGLAEFLRDAVKKYVR